MNRAISRAHIGGTRCYETPKFYCTSNRVQTGRNDGINDAGVSIYMWCNFIVYTTRILACGPQRRVACGGSEGSGNPLACAQADRTASGIQSPASGIHSPTGDSHQPACAIHIRPQTTDTPQYRIRLRSSGIGAVACHVFY